MIWPGWPSGRAKTQRSLILIRFVGKPARCSQWRLPRPFVQSAMPGNSIAAAHAGPKT